MLYPDGRVGELMNRDVKVQVELPSRIEGQKRMGEMIQPRLGEVAIHASLADYLRDKPGNTSDRLPYKNTWRLKDMPDETLAAYDAWCHSVQPLDINAICEAAATKVVSDDDRLKQSVPCPNCIHSDGQYACYSCGYAREVYAYPLARYHDNEAVYDIPVDIAAMIQMDPKALSHKTEWEIDDNGLMSATQQIVFDAQTIPKEYATGEKGDAVLTIDPVDDLYKKITFTTDSWAEGKKLKSTNRHHTLRPNETPTTYTPESYLDTLQRNVALHMYREQKDGKNYNAMIMTLQNEVGRRGLELAFEYKYMGMGDSEARFMIAKRVDDYVVTQPIAGSFIVEIAVEDAVEKLTKELR